MENPQLGRKILSHLEEHPGELDMDNWGLQTACGTTACLAGWAMLLSGYGLHGIIFTRPGNHTMVVFDAQEGATLLGLNAAEDYVFYESNATALDTFRKMVEEAEGRLGPS